MNSRLHHTATLIALCAIAAACAIPLGWMPGSQGELMALCTVNELIEVRLGGDAGLLDGAPPAHDGADCLKTIPGCNVTRCFAAWRHGASIS